MSFTFLLPFAWRFMLDRANNGAVLEGRLGVVGGATFL
jgi:hypothetical protein